MKLVSLFYLMPSLTNGIQGGFRGLGDLKITLNSSTLNMAGRVAAAAVFVLLMKWISRPCRTAMLWAGSSCWSMKPP